MKVSEFRKLIREEIRKVMSEGPYDITGEYYYIYFNGKDAIQGDAMDSKKELLKIGMDAGKLKYQFPVYEVKVDKYTVFVIISTTNKKDIWCVATPGDEKFANDEYSYKICMKAITAAKSGKGTQMTFKDFLK